MAAAVALVAGTIADRPLDRRPLLAGDFQVLSGDLHIHSAMWSGGTMTPWGLVGEARQRGLDVVAITDHNTVWGARAARAFSRFVPGPIVLAGEEVTSPSQDLIALGIQTSISPYLPLIEQIADVHRQGGVAIAAHPVAAFQGAYLDPGAADAIDGTEICHPVIYEHQGAGQELIDFARRTGAAPIGSSDFHAHGSVGICRTFLFVRDSTERDVLDAIRQHRTVVYANGQVFGDPALVQMAERLRLGDVAASYTRASGGVLDWVSRIAAAAALLGIALTTTPRSSHRAAAPRGCDPHAPAPRP
jgi:predicted metal-dependent phosphoesterase TrpH